MSLIRLAPRKERRAASRAAGKDWVGFPNPSPYGVGSANRAGVRAMRVQIRNAYRSGTWVVGLGLTLRKFLRKAGSPVVGPRSPMVQILGDMAYPI